MSDVITININANADGATGALGRTADGARDLGKALDGAGASGAEAGERIAEGMGKAEYSMMEARHAAMLFGEETGIRIPRALAGIAAQSETLGPILATAFSGVALIAFAELLVKGTEKLTEWIANTFIFTEAMKAADSALDKNNKTIVEYNAKATALAQAYDLIGLSGSKLTDFKLGLNSEDILKVQADLRALQDQLYGLRHGDISTEDAAGTVGLPRSATMESIVAVISGKEGELNAKLKALQQENQNLAKTYQEEAAKEAAKAQDEEYKNALKYDGLIAKAHAELNKELEKGTEENSKVYGEQLKAQLESELKLDEATEKNIEAQLKLNAAVAKSAAARQADLVAQDRAIGNTAKEQQDAKVLVELLEKQKNAELAIVDAKIAASEADMQVAFSTGGLNSADFQNAQAKWEQYQTERVTVAANADKQIQQANDQTLKEESKELQGYLNQFNSQFASAFAQVVMGHETITKAAQKMFASLAQMALQDLAKWVLVHAEKSAISALFHSQQTAQTAAAAAAQKAATTPSNVAEAISNAAVAATSAAAAAGPLAPAAAAATYGALSPFIALAGFDEGGMVPTTQIAMVHGGESVLTPQQTENFQQMTENGGGGDTHIHNHTWNTMDARSLQDFAKRNPGFFATGVNNAVKNGHINPSKLGGK